MIVLYVLGAVVMFGLLTYAWLLISEFISDTERES